MVYLNHVKTLDVLLQAEKELLAAMLTKSLGIGVFRVWRGSRWDKNLTNNGSLRFGYVQVHGFIKQTSTAKTLINLKLGYKLQLVTRNGVVASCNSRLWQASWWWFWGERREFLFIISITWCFKQRYTTRNSLSKKQIALRAFRAIAALAKQGTSTMSVSSKQVGIKKS